MDGGALRKRVTVFAGHYGSGKTNIAVNAALALAREGFPTAVADLDIVNPYFRTKDAAGVMEAAGIRFISSPYANSNVDTPALAAETYAVFEDKRLRGVIDVGGDDRGAYALGRYADYLREEGDFDLLLVVNKFRYLTRDVSSLLEVAREIREAAGLPFTGIVNNANLGEETTADDVIASVSFAKEAAEALSVPVVMTTVREDLMPLVKGHVPNVQPIRLYVRQSFQA